MFQGITIKKMLQRKKFRKRFEKNELKHHHWIGDERIECELIFKIINCFFINYNPYFGAEEILDDCIITMDVGILE